MRQPVWAAVAAVAALAFVLGPSVVLSQTVGEPLTWTDVEALNSYAAAELNPSDAAVALASSPTTVVAIWPSSHGVEPGLGSDDDLFFSRYDAINGTWSAAAVLNTNAASDSAASSDANVRLDYANGIFVAVWAYKCCGSDWDIAVARSVDDGRTWTDPANLNGEAVSDTDDDRLPVIAAGSNAWMALWSSDLGTAGLGLTASYSTDAGVSWSASRLLSYPNDTVIDVAPSHAEHGGVWLAVWQARNRGDTGDNTWSLYSARSLSLVGGFTRPAPFAAVNGSAGCFAPHVSVSAEGTWLVVFDAQVGSAGAETDVYFVISSDPTAADGSWSAPALISPAAATTGSGNDNAAVAVWVSSCGVVVAWSSADPMTAAGLHLGTDLDVVAVASYDAGASWSDPAPIAPARAAAANVTASDTAPQLAHLPWTGGVVAAWPSDDDLGGTIGADSDLVFAVSSAVVTAVCGDGQVTCGEVCDHTVADSDCCTAACSLFNASTVCRPAAGSGAATCDLPEMCDGATAACPSDSVLPVDTVCRASAGACDPAEVCDGASTACPDETLAPMGTVCRPSLHPDCDSDEECTGAGPACPGDVTVPAGTACDDGNSTTGPDVCDGSGWCAGDPLLCDPVASECNTCTCGPATGCTYTPVADGARCYDVDDDPCTLDSCVSGVCTAGPAFDCAPEDPCISETFCNYTGCVVEYHPEGSLCTSDDSTCTVEVCRNNTCVFEFAYECPVSECLLQNRCDGLGGCDDVKKADGVPCSNIDGNLCTLEACTSGVCTYASTYSCEAEVCEASSACDGFGGCDAVAKPDGTACDGSADTDPCTADLCAAGSCVALEPYACDTSDCVVSSVCNGSLGCREEYAPNNATCTDGDDGNACTVERCVDGSCASDEPYVCEVDASNDCIAAASCDGDGGCFFSPVADGTLCFTGDADPCTEDRCQAGVCRAVGAPTVCEAGLCEASSTCDGMGGCHVTIADNGTACDDGDGNLCTSGVCAAGACVEGSAYTCPVTSECWATNECDGTGGCNPVWRANHTVCSNVDGDACTVDVCMGGICTPEEATVCEAESDCVASSICDGAGGCTLVFVADDQACASADANNCTVDTCQAGICVAGPVYACDPSAGAQCTAAVCDGTGGCVDVSAPDGEACDDGDADSCTTGRCSGGACQAESYTCPLTSECWSSNGCDGTGGCVPVWLPDDTPCSNVDDDLCTADRCLSGACTAADEAVVCGPPASECVAEVVCNGSGGCVDVAAAGGTPCTAPAGAAAAVCLSWECDGNGACASVGLAAAGTGCVDACGQEGSCDGGTVCVPGSGRECTNGTLVSVCGDAIVDPSEECDDPDSLCCDANCRFASPRTRCDDGIYCTVSDRCDAAGVCSGRYRCDSAGLLIDSDVGDSGSGAGFIADLPVWAKILALVAIALIVCLVCACVCCCGGLIPGGGRTDSSEEVPSMVSSSSANKSLGGGPSRSSLSASSAAARASRRSSYLAPIVSHKSEISSLSRDGGGAGDASHLRLPNGASISSISASSMIVPRQASRNRSAAGSRRRRRRKKGRRKSGHWSGHSGGVDDVADYFVPVVDGRQMAGGGRGGGAGGSGEYYSDSSGSSSSTRRGGGGSSSFTSVPDLTGANRAERQQARLSRRSSASNGGGEFGAGIVGDSRDGSFQMVHDSGALQAGGSQSGWAAPAPPAIDAFAVADYGSGRQGGRPLRADPGSLSNDDYGDDGSFVAIDYNITNRSRDYTRYGRDVTR